MTGLRIAASPSSSRFRGVDTSVGSRPSKFVKCVPTSRSLRAVAFIFRTNARQPGPKLRASASAASAPEGSSIAYSSCLAVRTSPGTRYALVSLWSIAYRSSARVILIRRSRSPDWTTTRAVITLVRLAIGRLAYCLRPHSCLPVAALASSAARAAISRGGCAAAAGAALAWLAAGTARRIAPVRTRAPAARAERRAWRDIGTRETIGTREEWQARTPRASPPRLPARRKRHSLGVTGRALRPDDRHLVQFGERACARVGTGASQAGDDLVDEIFDAGTKRIEVHPRA